MQPGTFFLVRTRADPKSMVEVIRRKIHELEPRRSVYDLTPLGEHISDAYAQNRLRTILLAFFALTAVSLACIGLYGTLSYLVNVRRREVAPASGVGSPTHASSRTVPRPGSARGCGRLHRRPAPRGRLGQLLAGMLYGVSATDAATLAGVVAIVLAVSVIAALIPAMRAARIEPMQALREE